MIKKELKVLLHVTSDANAYRIIGTFYKRNTKNNSIDSGVEKVINRKSDKLYVEWKGYNNSFESWIYKKLYCYKK